MTIGQFRATEGWNKGGGHAFYSHLYAAQGFYMAGDEYLKWRRETAAFEKAAVERLGLQLK